MIADDFIEEYLTYKHLEILLGVIASEHFPKNDKAKAVQRVSEALALD